MAKDTFIYGAMVMVTLDFDKDTNKSEHVSTEFNLEISPNLKYDAYYKNGLPSALGCDSAIMAFTHGIIGAIHMEEQLGGKSTAENLRKVIAELEKGCFTPADLSASTFGAKGQ